MRAYTPVFLRHRALLGLLVKRDVLTRYRGALFGVFWVFLSPLLMLGIFAFVFGEIFQSRWPDNADGLPFWLVLYVGLLIFNVFAEAVSRAPAAVRSNPSYVKKIIFPLEILPLVPVGAGVIHGVFGLIVLAVCLLWVGQLTVGILLLPFLMSPVVLLAAGVSWFIAAWGVFIKDMTQLVPLFVQMLLFLSPIFYPASAVPSFLRPVYQFNPLAIVIEASRAAVGGSNIHWLSWFCALGIAVLVALLGYRAFQSQRDEFADAL